MVTCNLQLCFQLSTESKGHIEELSILCVMNSVVSFCDVWRNKDCSLPHLNHKTVALFSGKLFRDAIHIRHKFFPQLPNLQISKLNDFHRHITLH